MSKSKSKQSSGRRSKAKGGAFELLVVKAICKATNKMFDNTICYRTPRSGGHHIIGGADIIIKPKLREFFNFDIECKHRKTINVGKLFKHSAETKEFLKQALENTDEGGGYPMLVIRGNRTPVFCASPLSSLKSAGYESLTDAETPGLVFKFRGKTWKWFLFDFMMLELKRKTRQTMRREL